MEIFRTEALTGDRTCTLALAGDADLAIAQDVIELGVLNLAEAAIHKLIIDLVVVAFINSTAIGELLHLRNIAEDSNRKLVLTRVLDRVLHVLPVAGLEAV